MIPGVRDVEMIRLRAGIDRDRIGRVELIEPSARRAIREIQLPKNNRAPELGPYPRMVVIAAGWRDLARSSAAGGESVRTRGPGGANNHPGVRPEFRSAIVL